MQGDPTGLSPLVGKHPWRSEMTTHSRILKFGESKNRGGLWAIVHGVCKSWTWSSKLGTQLSTHIFLNNFQTSYYPFHHIFWIISLYRSIISILILCTFIHEWVILCKLAKSVRCDAYILQLRIPEYWTFQWDFTLISPFFQLLQYHFSQLSY